MKPVELSRCPGGRRSLVILFLAALSGVGPAGGHTLVDNPPGNPSAAAAPVAVEIHFLDDSVMKLIVLEERMELRTSYGRLLIPLADVRRIEVGWRIPADVADRIASAIADLGNSDFKRRRAATDLLRSLGEKAYPAVQQAAKGTDPEVIRRAEQLLAKFRDSIPEERRRIRDRDVIITADSKFCGRIANPTLRVKTFQFGEQKLKLTDLRGLRSSKETDPESEVATLPNPGTLAGMQNQVGKTFVIRVTGALPGNGGVWGTDVYTLDSSLAVAAVHAGLLRPGQAGVVRVTILGPVPGFQGSSRNGITSSGYGPYAGYRVHR